MRHIRDRVYHHQNSILTRIEDNYDAAINAGGFRINKAVVTSVHLFRFNMLSFEVIFVAFCIFIAFVATGFFGYFPTTNPALETLFWFLATLLNFLSIFVVITAFGVLHLQYRVTMLTGLVLSAILSSLLASYSVSLLSLWFFSENSIRFVNLLIPGLPIFIFTHLFLYTQNGRKIDFIRYRQRMQSNQKDPGINNHKAKDILMLFAQDHYVELTTKSGKHLERMRFSEAVEQMLPGDGVLAHRSYWVAKKAIKAVSKEKGKHFLTLTTGQTIPVSASKLPALLKALK